VKLNILDLQLIPLLKLLVIDLLTFLFFNKQDPTQQTDIDNFMVQKLDGTVNEWGWCKQKVLSPTMLLIYHLY
jgi:hypothetical protein